jgi:hypothetical protein
LGLAPDYVMLVLGNEGEGPHHMQGHHRRGPMDWVKEASGFDFEYSSYIKSRLYIYTPMFSPKVSMDIPMWPHEIEVT